MWDKANQRTHVVLPWKQPSSLHIKLIISWNLNPFYICSLNTGGLFWPLNYSTAAVTWSTLRIDFNNLAVSTMIYFTKIKQDTVSIIVLFYFKYIWYKILLYKLVMLAPFYALVEDYQGLHWKLLKGKLAISLWYSALFLRMCQEF